jgi:hypothetical protein
MLLDKNRVEQALNAVNDQLQASAALPIELVVCGGSALQALGLVNRTTRDLDILAQVSRGNDGLLVLNSAKILPDKLMFAANIVADDLNLPADWLNAGPTDLLTQGLPNGFIERLHTRKYGSFLTIHFIDRYDQICFKMYAAINGGGERHLSDLYQLNPSADEIMTAAQWCLTQDASEIFPLLVCDFLEKAGFDHAARQLLQ